MANLEATVRVQMVEHDPEPPVIPLSYLIKQSQAGQWLAIQQLLAAMGYIGAAGQSHLDNMDGWRIGDQRMSFGNNTASVVFDHVSLDPAHSDWEYGNTKVGNTESSLHPAQSYVFNNLHSDTDLEIEESHQVTLQQSRSTQTNTTIKDDLTTGAKVGGSALGVSLEASISNTFGWSTDKQKAESESSATTESVSIKKTVKAGEVLVAKLTAQSVASATPFTARGPWTGGVTISIQDGNLYGGGWPVFDPNNPRSNATPSPLCKAWIATAPSKGGWRSLRWDSLDDLADTFAGYDVSKPAFTADICKPVIPFIAHITDIDNRWISLKGVQRRQYEDSPTYDFTSGNCQSDADVEKLASYLAIPHGNIRAA